MRVAHVDSARGWRGGQNQVLLSALGMRARGHEVRILCRSGGLLEARAREAGLEAPAVPFRGDLWPAAAWRLRGLLRSFAPDVVHAHDPHAVSAALLARGGGGLVAARRVDFPLRGALSRRKYRACARVIAGSQAIARVLETAVAGERVRVVYEGVAPRPPQPGGREALAALGVPLSSPVVGNVAALVSHKDHATLLRAAALVRARRPEARFVIAGEGERRAALEAQARDLGLGESVAFAGFRRDLDRLIPAFDVFCLSSRMEGLGTSLLDAMCFARPVVATAAGGIPEAVEDGVTGRLVPARDHEALAGALLELLTDPERARLLGEAGRARFLDRFTADRMVEDTLRVYEELP
jgi:glycosyltransferase involved in cell wall biosynthesis